MQRRWVGTPRGTFPAWKGNCEELFPTLRMPLTAVVEVGVGWGVRRESSELGRGTQQTQVIPPGVRTLVPFAFTGKISGERGRLSKAMSMKVLGLRGPWEKVLWLHGTYGGARGGHSLSEVPAINSVLRMKPFPWGT